MSASRSAKVRRMHSGSKHRKRRARTRRLSGCPCQGRSLRMRSYRLWTRQDGLPQAGQAAQGSRGATTMMRSSGEGRIC